MTVETFVAALYSFQRALQRKFSDAGLYDRADWVRPNQPFIAGSPAAKLRANLIAEEAKELVDALHTEDIKAVTKEACDLLYVLLATVVVFGLPVWPAFWRVHENNTAKVAKGAVREDGKLCKPEDHPKVVLDDLFGPWGPRLSVNGVRLED